MFQTRGHTAVLVSDARKENPRILFFFSSQTANKVSLNNKIPLKVGVQQEAESKERIPPEYVTVNSNVDHWRVEPRFLPRRDNMRQLWTRATFR